MPWSGGSYTKGNAGTGGWTGDASLGIGIEAGRHDTQDNDFATGINNCLTKDGTNSATANINYGGFIPSNVGAGTAAAPAYCAGGDVNTGMFSPAADTIAWATNGTERMRITNAGNVGIGVTPTEKLDVNGSVYLRPSTAPTFDSGTRLWSESGFGANYDAFNHKFNVGAVTRAEAMRITNGGSVGIGITNPSSPLEVKAENGVSVAVTIRGRTADNSAVLRFADTSDSAEYARLASDSNGISLAASGARVVGISTNNAQRLLVTSGGDVGIGVNNPDATLAIAAQSSGGGAIRIRGRSSDNFGYIEFRSNNNSAPQGSISANGSTFEIAAINNLQLFGTTFTVQGIPAGAGTHFMKWNSATLAWTRDTSSIRYKDNVIENQYGLNAVNKMRPCAFTYKDSGRSDVGFLAEEMWEIIPEVVALNEDGQPDAISYDRLTSVLCKAIQELSAKVNALESQLA